MGSRSPSRVATPSEIAAELGPHRAACRPILEEWLDDLERRTGSERDRMTSVPMAYALLERDGAVARLERLATSEAGSGGFGDGPTSAASVADRVGDALLAVNSASSVGALERVVRHVAVHQPHSAGLDYAKPEGLVRAGGAALDLARRWARSQPDYVPRDHRGRLRTLLFRDVPAERGWIWDEASISDRSRLCTQLGATPGDEWAALREDHLRAVLEGSEPDARAYAARVVAGPSCRAVDLDLVRLALRVVEERIADETLAPNQRKDLDSAATELRRRLE